MDNGVKFKIYFTIQQVLMGMLISIFLFAPDDLFKITGIYVSTTPVDIIYKWLDYSFSCLFFIPIAFGIFILLMQKRSMYLLIPVLLFIRSVFRYLLQMDNIIENGAYEIILTILVGTCLFVWVSYMIDTEKVISWDNFLIGFSLMHVASQIVSLVFSLSGIAHRYNAINLDVEYTGFLCGFTFLFVFFSKSLNLKVLTLLGIGALLSGARIPIVFVVILLAIYIFLLRKDKISARINKGILLGSLIFVVTMACILLAFPRVFDVMSTKNYYASINRVTNLNLQTDLSALGRIRSLSVGFDVLKNNPLGLDCGFVFLQREMYKYNYPTFPHSSVLTYYLLFGPFCLMIIVYLFLKNVKTNLIECKKMYHYILPNVLLYGYLVLFSLFTGGPIVNYKVIFIYLLFFKVTTIFRQDTFCH